MDAQTLTALRGSIAKWEGIVAGRCSDEGTVNCPLCHVFYKKDCKGCPVKAVTGKPYCRDSPYSITEDVAMSYGTGSTKYTAAAVAELEFLKGLLPSDGEE